MMQGTSGEAKSLVRRQREQGVGRKHGQSFLCGFPEKEWTKQGKQV